MWVLKSINIAESNLEGCLLNSVMSINIADSVSHMLICTFCNMNIICNLCNLCNLCN